MLELFEVVEGEQLFNGCLLNHCNCGGTPDNCFIYAQWVSATSNIKELLEKTNLVEATWSHPEHRFDEFLNQKDSHE
jgi:DNA-binding IscR family transcriptional regulator